MKSPHSFSQVPQARLPRSTFNLSFGVKTAFDADYLVPLGRPIDVIPGDTFNTKMDFFMRLATPLHPILDNLYFESFFFFVPYRILWDNWEKMHGAQDDPADSIDFTVPVLSDNVWNVGELGDYFGIPTGVITSGVSALPLRAYNKIYNDWFRDENLQDSVNSDTDNGPDGGPGTFPLKKRGKRHDYFTSCLPWPQKGSAISLPLGTVAPVAVTDNLATGSDLRVLDLGRTDDQTRNLIANSGANLEIGALTGSSSQTDVLVADLSNASAATVNDLRLAFQTQRLLERDARGGTRYVEMLKAHYGVTSPDFRLQRPEFLGGGSSRVNVTPVAQTSGQPTPTADDKLGELAAFGTTSGQHGYTQSFVEHGCIIHLGNLRGDITYSQGLDRYWSKSTRFDFYYPALAQIGEQSVLNKEIYVAATATDEEVFGYQERYGEYRYLGSQLTNIMRPSTAGTLASWHLSEQFLTTPTLGDTFIQANTSDPLDRAIQVPTEPHMIADIFYTIKAARPMPLFGVPGNLDRL
ncbi:major capsid protein [Microviridae sp.]|nr:major capsid protein [Microviridae sp.]